MAIHTETLQLNENSKVTTTGDSYLSLISNGNEICLTSHKGHGSILYINYQTPPNCESIDTIYLQNGNKDWADLVLNELRGEHISNHDRSNIIYTNLTGTYKYMEIHTQWNELVLSNSVGSTLYINTVSAQNGQIPNVIIFGAGSNSVYADLGMNSAAKGANSINFGRSNTYITTNDVLNIYNTQSSKVLHINWNDAPESFVRPNKIVLDDGPNAKCGVTCGNVEIYGTCKASLGFFEESDKKLKTNIKPIKIKRGGGIKFVEFDRTDAPRHQYGVIAQDIEQIYPSIVHTDDEGIKSVDYIQILILKCQELENEIKQIKRSLHVKLWDKIKRLCRTLKINWWLLGRWMK